MAGIGFQLKKILAGDSYSSTLKAYAFSALLTSGPLFMTILVIVFINWVSIDSLTLYEQSYLRTLVTYNFAFSLVAVGFSYLVITRYLADEYYRKHTSSFSATFFSCTALNALVFGLPVLLYFSNLGVSWPLKLNALLLFMITLGIWLAMLFLSAAKNYMKIISAFAIGSSVSMLAAFFLGKGKGVPEYFSGFVLGQGITFLLLSLSIVREFGYREPRDYYWLKYFRRYPLLCAIGFLYNLGIWMDKFVFWVSSESTSLDINFRYSPVYDSPAFFAYLTIIPALAYFLIQMETDFFFKYQAYYKGIQNQESFGHLEKRRVEMIETLEHNFKHLIIFQSIITGFALVAVPWIVQIVRMNSLHMGVLRAGILGSYVLVGFLIVLLILLYFDCQKQAFFSTMIFCVSNGFFTYLSLRFGLATYGFGFAAASFVSLICAFCFLNSRLKDLHYWTFMMQPFPRNVVVLEDGN